MGRILKSKINIAQCLRWFKDFNLLYDIQFLSEDETVKLPTSDNIHSKDIVISKDVAIFATNKSSIKRRGP